MMGIFQNPYTKEFWNYGHVSKVHVTKKSKIVAMFQRPCNKGLWDYQHVTHALNMKKGSS